jgi:signal transduction histidine kinase
VRDRGSVFAKLVAAMVVMATCLLALVTVFFFYSIGPTINHMIFGVAEEFSRTMAATSPDSAAADSLARRLDLQIRYESPAGGWTTASWLPTIAQVRAGQVRQGHSLLLPKYVIAPGGPRGGTYLFAWRFSARAQAAHMMLLFLVLIVILAVVVTTHAVLRRLLRPLRVLNDGVTRLSEGQLDISLPSTTRDEFGKLTDAFNTMVARVRDMIRSRDQLLIDVSHELRSPITRMKVALELPPNGDQRARLGEDVAEMERMVSELLELERLRSGRGVHPSRHDLMAILREVADGFRDRPPGVRVTSAARELYVNVDAEKIRTVLRNLLENATKYSLPQSKPIEIAATADDHAVRVRVSDDGVGVPEADLDRVFEPFYRVDASRSKSTGGYGLGLSICKRVMEAHGGTIALERTNGRGATFVLTFPMA